MKRFLLLAILLISSNAYPQDLAYVKQTMQTLTSPKLWGRGYTKGGMGKAADFIADEFRSFKLIPMGNKDFKQTFFYNANTFPGKMEVNINGVKLIPGRDYIIEQSSQGLRTSAVLVQKDSTTFVSQQHQLAVVLQDKLTWSVSQSQADYTVILVKKSVLKENPTTISTNVEAILETNFRASNICGFVKGIEKPDSIILFTAHYDHLGGMGANTYFPGANDNASGVSLLLSLVKYYSSHPQKYSIGFICFAGEEAGILGSKYFTENPLFPLANIRFLVNVDMVGTGEAGATVVNATQYPREFKLLNGVNDKNKLLVKINSRGKAANSDHYFFTEKGVPAFFLYTQGGISAYHDIFDRAETLPLTVYENLFRLFVDFNQLLMN